MHHYIISTGIIGSTVPDTMLPIHDTLIFHALQDYVIGASMLHHTPDTVYSIGKVHYQPALSLSWYTRNTISAMETAINLRDHYERTSLELAQSSSSYASSSSSSSAAAYEDHRRSVFTKNATLRNASDHPSELSYLFLTPSVCLTKPDTDALGTILPTPSSSSSSPFDVNDENTGNHRNRSSLSTVTKPSSLTDGIEYTLNHLLPPSILSPSSDPTVTEGYRTHRVVITFLLFDKLPILTPSFLTLLRTFRQHGTTIEFLIVHCEDETTVVPFPSPSTVTTTESVPSMSVFPSFSFASSLMNSCTAFQRTMDRSFSTVPAPIGTEDASSSSSIGTVTVRYHPNSSLQWYRTKSLWYSLYYTKAVPCTFTDLLGYAGTMTTATTTAKSTVESLVMMNIDRSVPTVDHHGSVPTIHPHGTLPSAILYLSPISSMGIDYRYPPFLPGLSSSSSSSSASLSGSWIVPLMLEPLHYVPLATFPQQYVNGSAWLLSHVTRTTKTTTIDPSLSTVRSIHEFYDHLYRYLEQASVGLCVRIYPQDTDTTAPNALSVCSYGLIIAMEACRTSTGYGDEFLYPSTVSSSSSSLLLLPIVCRETYYGTVSFIETDKSVTDSVMTTIPPPLSRVQFNMSVPITAAFLASALPSSSLASSYPLSTPTFTVPLVTLPYNPLYYSNNTYHHRIHTYMRDRSSTMETITNGSEITVPLSSSSSSLPLITKSVAHKERPGTLRNTTTTGKTSTNGTDNSLVKGTTTSTMTTTATTKRSSNRSRTPTKTTTRTSNEPVTVTNQSTKLSAKSTASSRSSTASTTINRKNDPPPRKPVMVIYDEDDDDDTASSLGSTSSDDDNPVNLTVANPVPRKPSTASTTVNKKATVNTITNPSTKQNGGTLSKPLLPPPPPPPPSSLSLPSLPVPSSLVASISKTVPKGMTGIPPPIPPLPSLSAPSLSGTKANDMEIEREEGASQTVPSSTGLFHPPSSPTLHASGALMMYPSSLSSSSSSPSLLPDNGHYGNDDDDDGIDLLADIDLNAFSVHAPSVATSKAVSLYFEKVRSPPVTETTVEPASDSTSNPAKVSSSSFPTIPLAVGTSTMTTSTSSSSSSSSSSVQPSARLLHQHRNLMMDISIDDNDDDDDNNGTDKFPSKSSSSGTLLSSSSSSSAAVLPWDVVPVTTPTNRPTYGQYPHTSTSRTTTVPATISSSVSLPGSTPATSISYLLGGKHYGSKKNNSSTTSSNTNGTKENSSNQNPTASIPKSTRPSFPYRSTTVTSLITENNENFPSSVGPIPPMDTTVVTSIHRHAPAVTDNDPGTDPFNFSI